MKRTLSTPKKGIKMAIVEIDSAKISDRLNEVVSMLDLLNDAIKGADIEKSDFGMLRVIQDQIAELNDIGNIIYPSAE